MILNYETAANIASVIVPVVGGLVAIYKIRCDKNTPAISSQCSLHRNVEDMIKNGLKELRDSVDSLRDEILEIYKRGV